MRSVLIHLDDDEYNRLIVLKGEKTWKELLLQQLPEENKNK